MDLENTEQSSEPATYPNLVMFIIIGANLLLGLLPLLMMYSWHNLINSVRDFNDLALEISDETFARYKAIIRCIKNNQPHADKSPMFLVGNMFLTYRQLKHLLNDLKKNPNVAQQLEVIISADLTSRGAEYASDLPRFKKLYIEQTDVNKIFEDFIRGKKYPVRSPLLFREVDALLERVYKSVEDDFSMVAILSMLGFTDERIVLLKILSYYRQDHMDTLARGLLELFGPQNFPVQETALRYKQKFITLADRHLCQYKMFAIRRQAEQNKQLDKGVAVGDAGCAQTNPLKNSRF